MLCWAARLVERHSSTHGPYSAHQAHVARPMGPAKALKLLPFGWPIAALRCLFIPTPRSTFLHQPLTNNGALSAHFRLPKFAPPHPYGAPTVRTSPF